MALLKFNSKNLDLELVIGLEEEFKPLPQITEMGKKISDFKKETNEFIKKTWGDKSQSDLLKLLSSSEEDKKLWTDFLETKYNLEVGKFIQEIKEINKIICPGFSAQLDKLVTEEE